MTSAQREDYRRRCQNPEYRKKKAEYERKRLADPEKRRGSTPITSVSQICWMFFWVAPTTLSRALVGNIVFHPHLQKGDSASQPRARGPSDTISDRCEKEKQGF